MARFPGRGLLAIGTRPDDAAHWFARLLKRNGTTYAADPDADPFDPATWGAANPSLRHFPALLAVYQREADEAQADPSLLPAFRALRLNLGTADHEIAVLIEAAAWERAEVDILPAAKGPCCWGVDLSGGDAMAAISCYWPTSGRLEAVAAFPALPDLAERGRTDGADYGRMARRWRLACAGRRAVPRGAGSGADRGGAGALAAAGADHRGLPSGEGVAASAGGGELPGRVADDNRHGLGGFARSHPRFPAGRTGRARMGGAAAADPLKRLHECPHRLRFDGKRKNRQGWRFRPEADRAR